MDCGINAGVCVVLLATGSGIVVTGKWFSEHLIAVNAAGRRWRRIYAGSLPGATGLLTGIAISAFALLATLNWFGECAAFLSPWSMAALVICAAIGVALVVFLALSRLRLDRALAADQARHVKRTTPAEERTRDGNHPRVDRDKRRVLWNYGLSMTVLAVAVGLLVHVGSSA